jgi:hypothetical protein
MKNFNVEDLSKLVKFYKEKSSELEFEILKLQINNQKDKDLLVEGHKEEIKRIIDQKTFDDKNFKNKILKLEDQIKKIKKG